MKLALIFGASLLIACDAQDPGDQWNVPSLASEVDLATTLSDIQRDTRLAFRSQSGVARGGTGTLTLNPVDVIVPS